MFRSSVAGSDLVVRRIVWRQVVIGLSALLLTMALSAGCGIGRGGVGPETSPQLAETVSGTPLEPSPTISKALPTSPPATSTATTRPTPSATATAPPTATLVPKATPETIRAKIEVVWPHDGADVREANLANITAYLISETGNEAPPCDWEPTVRLWVAQNSQPARPIAVAEKRMIATGGRRFPAWDFNDVDVSAARDPANKLTFFVTVDGVQTLHNVWVHAADARTIFPQLDIPAGVVSGQPEAVDARIEVVWPHDDLPVAEATLANITGFLFDSGTKQAIPPDLGWSPAVRLHRSQNVETETVEAAQTAPIGASRVITSENGVAFLAWDFDNIDVSSAQDSLNKIYFWLSVDDEVSYPNVWAHGANTPTIFPQTDVLNSCK
jgi:hypothetical protein